MKAVLSQLTKFSEVIEGDLILDRDYKVDHGSLILDYGQIIPFAKDRYSVTASGVIFAERIYAKNIGADCIIAGTVIDATGRVEGHDILAGEIYAVEVRAINIQAMKIKAHKITAQYIDCREIEADELIKADLIRTYKTPLAKTVESKLILYPNKRSDNFYDGPEREFKNKWVANY